MTAENLDPVHIEIRQSVGFVWINNPPVNALSHAVRASLADKLAGLETEAGVKAIALAAIGRTFPAGADISEFGSKPKAPSLPDLCNLIEAFAKPVVAVLHGTALGGGMELALAAHRRISAADTKLGFPEVTLGILPGAGGTQRLPRLVGAEHALRLMLTGRPIGAQEALSIGMIDEVVTGDLTDAAIKAALALVAVPTRVQTRDRRDGFRDMVSYQSAILTARRAMASRSVPAPGRIIDCVEAAPLLPFDQGLDYERAAFTDLVGSPEAEALRYMFFAERRCAKSSQSSADLVPVKTATIIGFDEAAVALAQALTACGVTVQIVERNEAQLEVGLEKLAVALDADVSEGRLSKADQDSRWARVVPVRPDEANLPTDLLFLTGVYARSPADQLDFSFDPALPIVTLGRAPTESANTVGLVLEPVWPQGRYAEVLVSDSTSPEVAIAVTALVRRLGRVVVQTKGTSISASMMRAMQSALNRVGIEHGRDKVLELLQIWGMVARNEEERARAKPDQDIFGEIALPVLGAMANAGLHLLGEGRAARPSDIDLAMVLGHGFPRWAGGPMLWASRRGLLVLRMDLLKWAEINPDLWTPAPLLDDLIRQGVTLAQLNEA